MVEIIIAFLTGVLGPVILLLIKDHLTKRKKPDPLVEAVANANIINDELEKIMTDFAADRVWVTQFHNGGHYYPTGKSIQKFSIFFESVKHTKDSIRAHFQNIPVNLFSRPLSQLVSNNYISIPDYKDETVATYGLKYVAEEHGTKSSYIFGIRNLDGRLIGVIGLEYTSRKKTLSPEEVVLLRVESARLGGVLMSHL